MRPRAGHEIMESCFHSATGHMAGKKKPIQLKFQCPLTPSKATEYSGQKRYVFQYSIWPEQWQQSSFIAQKHFYLFPKPSSITVTDLLLLTRVVLQAGIEQLRTCFLLCRRSAALNCFPKENRGPS